MTLKRGTIGSGLTEKATLSWSGKGARDNPEIAAILKTGTLDGLIESIERACFDILVEAGLPGEHGSYAYKHSGEWKPWQDESIFGEWGIAATVEPIAKARGFAPDSPVGFAAAMMDRIYWIRDNQRRGDHDRAALFAFYLGVLRAESRIKLEHESVWKSGKGSRDGSQEGAAKRAEAFKHRHAEIRADFEERWGRTGDERRAKKATAGAFGISRRQLNRILAK